MRVLTLVALGNHPTTVPGFWRPAKPIPECDASRESLAKLQELWYNQAG
jgi:hypothetical protein